MFVLVALLLVSAPIQAATIGAPAHDRPFLMPPAERQRLLDLAAREPWAADELARQRKAAAKDGYAAALLYALEGGAGHLAVARRWLLDYAAKGGDIPMAKAKLNDAEFFKGGQPWISPVYYNLDVRPLVAYDWVFPGLTKPERVAVEAGILTSARFRVKCMDRWTQTPNLVFKPTFMVAVAGLVTQDRDLLAWGFERKPGSRLGGYFPVLDVMLDAGGPWKEAPIYPVAHRDLALMGLMSRLLRLSEGVDRFARPAAGGGSPKGLMDYFIDTAYPPEAGPSGERRIRVLTYGDGATSPRGDLFLAGDGGGAKDLSLAEALAESWAASGDARYAAFLALDPAYRAALPDRPALPRETALPPAPSKVWESFGLAFLRSDESPRYWESGRALAASLLMSRGYGHDHRDKFGITFFGAGRLLYPDWNHEQYENAAIGWTRNTISHNTLMVDEEDARDAEPAAVRSDFKPGAKFVSVEAEGVFPGVRQGRALLLTERYLLDVFSARSGRPRTYDWLLHGSGRLEPGGEGSFTPAAALGPRYARMQQEASGATDGPWRRGFVVGDGGVRVLMAAEAGTQVVTGTGYDGNAMLVVRRDGVRETTFVAVHEPVRAGERGAVRKVSVIGRSAGEIVVRVEGEGWAEEHRVPTLTLEGRGQGEGGNVSSPTAPRLRSDYRTSATPLFRVEAPSLRAGLDMRTGLVRHLSGPDGVDRLGGKPLFTFSAGGKELLSERTVKAFTWPTESPASLMAEVESVARYRLLFFFDRILVGMDRDWTQAKQVLFTVPGAWAADGNPRWAGVEEQGGKTAAAELAFPGGAWSICFEFTPPQRVAFDGAGMSFEIGALTGEAWSAGFCRPGALQAWRWAPPRSVAVPSPPSP